MIQVQHLTKSFNGQPVLRGVDLEVPKGSITIIIGRSGGGKSVFLKHLLGLLHGNIPDVLDMMAELLEPRLQAGDA